jgi:hypothetical protein
MKIDTTVMIPVAAVVASVLLLMSGKKRVFEIIALIASAAWLLVNLGIFAWPLDHRFATADIVVGAVLLITGISVYLGTDNKREVTASTVLAILGGVLLAGASGRLG